MFVVSTMPQNLYDPSAVGWLLRLSWSPLAQTPFLEQVRWSNAYN
jgi:hypothetical protein